VTHIGDRRVSPATTAVANPAFDVTPARLVSAIVTEAGVATRPYRQALERLSADAAGYARQDPSSDEETDRGR
jgi:methylthioribose-1-phosphate isomerase